MDQGIQNNNKLILKSDSSSLPFIDESIENVGQSTVGYLKRRWVSVTTWMSIAVLLELIFFFSKVDDFRIYFIPLIIPVVGYSNIRNNIQHEFMWQFAAANNFIYSRSGTLDGLDGSLFQIGHAGSAYDVVDGKYQNCPITLLSYSYRTGSGKYQQSHYDTIFKLQFDIAMPDILLERVGHSFGGTLFGLGHTANHVHLEGDFNKYFTLSVPRGYEIEALEVFTPDVMAELIDKAKQFSLEIVNGHLFIYDSKVVGTKDELYTLYELARYFVEKLAPVLSRMKRSLDANIKD